MGRGKYGWLWMSVVLSLWAFRAHAEHTRVTYPGALSGEVLGRAMMFSVNYDHVFSDDLAAGAGIGTTGTKPMVGSGDTGVSATVVPVYFNYYLSREGNSAYVTAGVSAVVNSGDVKNLRSSAGNVDFPDSPLVPHFGAGFESRTDTGWLFRVAGYGILGEELRPWVGFSFGKTF
jgi:hypothetical protein